MKQFQPPLGKLKVEASHAGHVAVGPIEARNKSKRYWIGAHAEHNRNFFVACIAALAEGTPPAATMTATFSAARSEAIAAIRS
jgi:hypothetical protein